MRKHAKHARERKPLHQLRLCSPETSEALRSDPGEGETEPSEKNKTGRQKECVRVRVRVRVIG